MTHQPSERDLLFQNGYETGLADSTIALTAELAVALGFEYTGQSWDSLICLVDKACGTLVNRETAERIGREVHEDFKHALAETQELAERMDVAARLK